MRAMRYHAFGDPSTICNDTVDEPALRPDELLIDVSASSINPADWQLGAGYAQGMIDISLPFTPGIDFSGVVRAVGSSVSVFTAGQQVYGAELLERSGAFAEVIAVPAARVAPAPNTLPLPEAAAVPLAAITAWEATYGSNQANLQPGQTVLIHGGAGGTGMFAVQFARLRGGARDSDRLNCQPRAPQKPWRP
jgi:NADPH:quinone reductase-like Zn-dependent oxidoreductase